MTNVLVLLRLNSHSVEFYHHRRVVMTEWIARLTTELKVPRSNFSGPLIYFHASVSSFV